MFLTKSLLILLLAALVLQPSDVRADQSTFISAQDSRARSAAGRVESSQSLEDWLVSQERISLAKLLANLSPAGAARGAVVASPSRHDPDYFFHWVRDAGLVMDVIQKRYALAAPEEKNNYFRLMDDFTSFSRLNQLTVTLTGLGEPKFYADGRAYNEPWGRPQNDSPALRALSLIRFANQLLAEGREDYVREKLYRAKLPAHTVIKADLEFVSHHWREKNFDLWEEVRGDHFYTRAVQRAALLEGADLADRLGDPSAAKWYRQQADLLEREINNHWDPTHGIYRITLNEDGGVDYKYSGLDAAVILAVLHVDTDNGPLSAMNDRVLSTAEKIENVFASIYPINHQNRSLGTAIGRYPEDRYYGGNPWILTTAAFAELYYRVAKGLKASQSFVLTEQNIGFFRNAFEPSEKKLLKIGQNVAQDEVMKRRLVRQLTVRGDAFLERVRYHAYADGSMSEQIRKDNGYMESASDLTWSYASCLTAFAWRP